MKNRITKNSTVREVLQVIGTELLRNNFNNNIHVASTIGNIKDTDKVIIPDTRFKNEAQAIRDRGGILLRINRDSESASTHPSETDLDDWDDWDYIIDNNYNLDALFEQVKTFCKEQEII